MTQQQSGVACTCAHCGKEFRVPPSRIRYGWGHYCSNACSLAVYRSTFPPLEERLWARVDKTGECWLWQGAKNDRGYGIIGLTNTKKTRLTHRVVWELTYGPIPKGIFVCHHCDTPACVRPDHLFLGSHQDNMDDMWKKGRDMDHMHPESRPRGERHGTARLTEEGVRQIRTLHVSGVTIADIARQFTVSESTIRFVVQRKTWRHVV